MIQIWGFHFISVRNQALYINRSYICPLAQIIMRSWHIGMVASSVATWGSYWRKNFVRPFGQLYFLHALSDLQCMSARWNWHNWLRIWLLTNAQPFCAQTKADCSYLMSTRGISVSQSHHLLLCSLLRNWTINLFFRGRLIYCNGHQSFCGIHAHVHKLVVFPGHFHLIMISSLWKIRLKLLKPQGL